MIPMKEERNETKRKEMKRKESNKSLFVHLEPKQENRKRIKRRKCI